MTRDQARRATPLWAAWILLTTAGWIVGSALAWILTSSFGPLRESALGLAAAGAAVGAAVGLGQWLVLRRRLRGGYSWVLCTAFAWGVGALAGAWISDTLFDDYWLLALIPSAIVFATAVGLGQWLLLRRVARGAGWWVPTSALAWAAAGSISLFSGPGAGVSLAVGLFPAIGLTGWIVSAGIGAAAGALTGFSLVRLAVKVRADPPAYG